MVRVRAQNKNLLVGSHTQKKILKLDRAEWHESLNTRLPYNTDRMQNV